jgi:parvulin-like peptidyl-prolyl isomerase
MVNVMKKVIVIVVLLCVVSMAQAEKMLVDGIAARVNGDVVTIGEVVRVMMPLQQALVSKYRGEVLREKLQSTYEDSVDSLIERSLILSAYKEQDMKIPEWLVDERVEEVIRDSFKGDRSELMAVLAREHVSFSEWRETWKDRIIIASMRSSFVGQKIKVSPKSIRERYDKDKDKYRQSGKMKLRMIFLRSVGSVASGTAEARAGEVFKKLEAGELFADLAKEYSGGSHAESGGDWGWVEPGTLRKEITDGVSKLKPGAVSGVIETKKGLYIVKVEARKEALSRSFEQVRSEIEDELRRESGKEIYEAWVARLAEDAFIEVSDVDLFSEK